MSTKPNHRRKHGRIQGNGPRWENPNPEAGCNSTHVARSRRKWQNRRRRQERRDNKHAVKDAEDQHAEDYEPQEDYVW
jgi:hypothetical protein